ncbi:MAG TPA: 3-phosphoshikimate 1-carboxyvinyltransferase, partial [Spirochaetota bacterium]
YVEMTMQWLDRCGIRYEHDNMQHFRIPGNQKYKPFDVTIPADFSSASFFLVGGAISGGPVTLEGLDYKDTQGDKRVADILRAMGARVSINESSITIEGPLSNGGEFDLNEIPDSLPILSVAGCFAPGKTILHNVAHARIKETDRIAVMRSELVSLGGVVTERDDGLIIEHSPLLGGTINGHGDHRVIMSGAIAGSASGKGVHIHDADAVSVTFPQFANLFRACGGKITEE